jgi:hypothetical protein
MCVSKMNLKEERGDFFQVQWVKTKLDKSGQSGEFV